MTRALLLYNPVSGNPDAERVQLVEQVASVLRGHGFTLDVQATEARGSAGEQARRAVENGAHVVFVCGGDGTIHDVLQGLASTRTMLAPIPMGRGNALCRQLQMTLEPLQAAAAYKKAAVREVRLGDYATEHGGAFFLLLAGAGPDGTLMYRMLTTRRGWMGRWAYAAHALRILLRGRFPAFRVSYEMADGVRGEITAVSAMALRVGSLGGMFPGVAHGALLEGATMRLVMVKPPGWLALPLWFLSSWLRLERWNRFLVIREVVAFECEGADVHAEADGEWAGRLPFRAGLTEKRVRLLVPDR